MWSAIVSLGHCIHLNLGFSVILLVGSFKGCLAPQSTILWQIRQVCTKAYALEDRNPSFPVIAYSTHSVCVSLTFMFLFFCFSDLQDYHLVFCLHINEVLPGGCTGCWWRQLQPFGAYCCFMSWEPGSPIGLVSLFAVLTPWLYCLGVAHSEDLKDSVSCTVLKELLRLRKKKYSKKKITYII